MDLSTGQGVKISERHTKQDLREGLSCPTLGSQKDGRVQVERTAGGPCCCQASGRTAELWGMSEGRKGIGRFGGT